MATALIADSHLGGPGGEAAPLVEQLRALPAQGCDRLILMGDIFQAWVGFPQFETPEIREVVVALDELRKAGVSLYYIEGNRDFFLAEGPYAKHFDAVLREFAFEENGVRYLAVHGDGLNEADRKYLFWRWLSKSLPSRLGFRFLPGPLARRMVDGTERRLSKTNWKHKQRVPEEVIRRYGEERCGEGHDVLLLGHFHEPHTWQLGTPGESDPKEIRLFDAWYNSRRVEWLDGREG